MLNTPFSQWPSFTREEADAISTVLLSNKVNYWTGEQCRRFEEDFANWTGSQFAVALSNGTVALDLALKALGIQNGDEVITTPRTFLASVSSIVNIGAKPVFADVDRNSQNISASTIEKKITPATKAIIVVHLAGMPADMDAIMAMAKKYDLYVIEDCAQAHGAFYKGRSVGTIGDIGAWSFCQDKIMTTGGEGGMVTTNSKDLWEKMWSYKDHGKSWDAVYNMKHPDGFRWLHDSFGTNWRMTEIQAAIGRIQLTRLEGWNKQRNENAECIWNACKKHKALRVPDLTCGNCTDICTKVEKCIHAAYKCYVFIRQEFLKSDWDRDRVMREINKNEVPCFSGSCSEVYLERAFDNTDFRPESRLPVAKELGETSLMFLVHPTLTSDEIEKTCTVIDLVMKEASN